MYPLFPLIQYSAWILSQSNKAGDSNWSDKIRKGRNQVVTYLEITRFYTWTTLKTPPENS
jgi:hypothetical protein